MTPRYLWDDGLSRSQAEEITLVFQKTSSSTIAPVTKSKGPALVGMGANLDFSTAALCQASVNTLLGMPTATETTEVDCATYFASAPMGVDAMGIVASFSGQVRSVVAMTASLLPTASTAGTAVGVPPGALSATLATNGFVATTNGNVAARIVLTGLDAAATGSLVLVKFYVELK